MKSSPHALAATLIIPFLTSNATATPPPPSTAPTRTPIDVYQDYMLATRNGDWNRALALYRPLDDEDQPLVKQIAMTMQLWQQFVDTAEIRFGLPAVQRTRIWLPKANDQLIVVEIDSRTVLHWNAGAAEGITPLRFEQIGGEWRVFCAHVDPSERAADLKEFRIEHRSLELSLEDLKAGRVTQLDDLFAIFDRNRKTARSEMISTQPATRTTTK